MSDHDEGQPGESSVVRKCPRCLDYRQFAAFGGSNNLPAPKGAPDFFRRDVYIYACVVCKSPLMIDCQRHGQPLRWINDEMRVYPAFEPRKEPVYPAIVSKAFFEAQLCASVRAWNAAAVMVRRAVEEACKEQGASAKLNLEKKIDDLAARHVITPSLQNWAHEVRLIGNDGAHGDKGITSEDRAASPEDLLADVTEEDCDDAIAFAESLFEYLYVMPAKLSQRRRR
jgi:hypothetical protein